MDNNDYIVCDECNVSYTKNEIDMYEVLHRPWIVCQHCTNDKYTGCDKCQKFVYNDDIMGVEGDYLCRDCFDSYVRNCDYCEGHFYQDNLHWLEYCEDSLCDNCFDEHTSMCNDCDETYYNEDLRLYRGDSICESCYEHQCSEASHGRFSGSYTYYKLPKEPENSLYFGIELEAGVSRDTAINFKHDILDQLPNCVFPKEDSSIYDCHWVQYGVEIVSHPMTYRWLKKNKGRWNKILQLRKIGLRSYTTNSCGIHIHLTKSYFTEKHLYKFMKMIYCQPAFTSLISQRKRSELVRWGSISDKEDLRKKAKDKYFAKRYTAVNLSNANTIEIRIFRGTLHKTAFWKNIEYLQALVEFTQKAKLTDLTLKKFMEYIKCHHKKFQHLYRWLSKKGKIK